MVIFSNFRNHHLNSEVFHLVSELNFDVFDWLEIDDWLSLLLAAQSFMFSH